MLGFENYKTINSLIFWEGFIWEQIYSLLIYFIWFGDLYIIEILIKLEYKGRFN